MSPKRWLLVAAAAVANVVFVAVVVGALVDDGPSAPPTLTEPSEPGEPPYYLSLGDSYAQGFQPNGDFSNGFADQIVDRAGERGYEFDLVNLGCGGATTTSMLEAPGCPFPAEGAPSYADVPQLVAAEEFLRAHPGGVGLITVSIGGNDVGLCAGTPDPVECFDTVMAEIGPKLTALVARLRAAAGPDVPIVGTSYPNIVLGRWIQPPVNEDLARLSTEVYRQLYNPVLREAYEKAGATFVDVSEATGGYGPLTETTELEPYGEIPTAVATVCELTYYCRQADVHPNTEGYAVIADLVLATLPDRGG